MLNRHQKENALKDLKRLIENGMPFPAVTSGSEQAQNVIAFIEKFGEYMYPDMPETAPTVRL